MSSNRLKSLFDLTPHNPFESVISQDPLDWFFRSDIFSNKHSISTEVYEQEDHYEVVVEVPGFSREELDISVKQGHLVITGKKENKASNRRSTSEVSRRIALGDSLDTSKITASLKDGILTINIPKGGEDKSQKIDIK